jgi:hypothetical protein
MQQNTTDSLPQRWTRRAFGACAFVLLAAVPALALTTLAPAGFALPPLGDVGPGTAHAAGVSQAPFTFDAPTVTLRRVRPGEGQDAGSASGEGSVAAGKNPMVLADWQFTQFTQQQLATLLAAQYAEDAIELPNGALYASLILASAPQFVKQSRQNLVLANLGWFLFDVDDWQPFLANLTPLQRLILLELLFNTLKHPPSSPSH